MLLYFDSCATFFGYLILSSVAFDNVMLSRYVWKLTEFLSVIALFHFPCLFVTDKNIRLHWSFSLDACISMSRRLEDRVKRNSENNHIWGSTWDCLSWFDRFLEISIFLLWTSVEWCYECTSLLYMDRLFSYRVLGYCLRNLAISVLISQSEDLIQLLRVWSLCISVMFLKLVEVVMNLKGVENICWNVIGVQS